MDLPDLRPLSFGELLDRTFTYYRRHFWTFVGIMAVPHVLLVAVSVGWQSIQSMLLRPAAGGVPGEEFGSGMIVATFAGAILVIVLYFVVYAVALGAATHAVSEIHLGRPTSVRAAYRSMRGRTWRMADLIITLIIRIILIYIVIMFGSLMIGGFAGVLVGMVGSGLGPAVGILIGLAVIAMLLAGAFLAVWMILRYGCSVPAMLVENIKASAAIKRSVELTKGNIGRVFLVTVLMTLVNITIILIFQGPFYVVFFLMAARSPGTPPPLWLTAAMNVSGGVGGALTGSLLMIGLVLLYYDIRVRKEGFDLQVMMAALDAQSPVEGVSPQTLQVAAKMDLERKSVLLVILLTIVTFGLYYPYWFFRSKSGINSLNSQRKMNVIIPGFVFVVWLVRFVLAFVSGVLRGSDSLPQSGLVANVYSGMPEFDSVVTLAGGILLLIQCFKVKAILEEHTSVPISGPLAGSLSLVQRTSFSAVATFFLGIYYLQYKINEIVDASPQSAAAPRAVPGL